MGGMTPGTLALLHGGMDPLPACLLLHIIVAGKAQGLLFILQGKGGPGGGREMTCLAIPLSRGRMGNPLQEIPVLRRVGIVAEGTPSCHGITPVGLDKGLIFHLVA